MAFDASLRNEIQQRMEKPRIANVYLRCFDLAFADVLVPRLKLPHDQRVGELVAEQLP
jgi:hypothetical protein